VRSPVRTGVLQRRGERGAGRRPYPALRLALVAVVSVALATVATPQAVPRTIAVASVSVDRSLRPLRERARTTFEPLLETRLREAGYAVMPAAVADSVWNAVRDSAGGYYDTYTGAVVREKLRAVYEGTRRRLRALGADAWLVPSIEVVHPGFSGDEARWNGVSESTGGRGGLAGFLIGRSVGTLTALSLDAQIEDTERGAIVHHRRGGIQLSAKIVDGALREIAPDALLRDGERNAMAVTLALDSLTVRWPAR